MHVQGPQERGGTKADHTRVHTPLENSWNMADEAVDPEEAEVSGEEPNQVLPLSRMSKTPSIEGAHETNMVAD